MTRRTATSDVPLPTPQAAANTRLPRSHMEETQGETKRWACSGCIPSIGVAVSAGGVVFIHNRTVEITMFGVTEAELQDWRHGGPRISGQRCPTTGRIDQSLNGLRRYVAERTVRIDALIGLDDEMLQGAAAPASDRIALAGIEFVCGILPSSNFGQEQHHLTIRPPEHEAQLRVA